LGESTAGRKAEELEDAEVKMKKRFYLVLMLGVALVAAGSCGAQEPPPGTPAAAPPAAPDARQTYYAALLTRGPQWALADTPAGAPIQQAHVANLRKLMQEGKLVLAGPFTDDGQNQGLLIFQTNTQKEAEDLVKADPGVQAGRFNAEVHPWLGPKDLNAGQPPPAVPPTEHVLLTPGEVKFGPAPPSLPPGAQAALLSGDPTKAGAPFTLRAKFPDGYKIPPHWHPTDENIVVLQGTLMSALGEKFDEAAGHPLVAGSYGLMPKGVRHFSWAKGETVVQMYGVGPFEVNYVNPADDPRHK
jgi:uncharacterized protein YciI/quercetin dioxygenase-like cupin family protein